MLVPLAGRVFEKHRHRRPDPFERLIEPVCDPCDSLFFACPHVRPRVEYDERDTEKARPFHFINESVRAISGAEPDPGTPG